MVNQQIEFKSKIIYYSLLIILLSCSNSRNKQNERESDGIVNNDNWVEIELRKQLSKTTTSDSIVIHGLPIGDIPKLLCQYTDLKYLRINCVDFSCMTSLSKDIVKFKNLETLIISKSALKELPKEIWELENLRKLKVSGGGQLSSIPIELSRLSKLEELDLSRNKLSEFPVELSNLTSLKTVNLGENNFPENYLETMADRFPNIEFK